MELDFPIMIISNEGTGEGVARSGLAELEKALSDIGAQTMQVAAAEDFAVFGTMTSRASSLIYPVASPRQSDTGEGRAVADLRSFVEAVRRKNEGVPIFLFGERLTARDIPSDIVARVHGFINAYEDTPHFVARSIAREANHYVEALAPPFFSALMKYANDGAYSWHCPGHSGGTAFLKSPVGTLFHQFFGENLLRSDVCNAVEELGQLLDHTGPVAQSEMRAARTFSADHLYFVTNGTSTSNKIVWNSMVGPGDIVVVDRNCHKSVLHAIMLTGATPIYLMPTRNRAGIIGPIPRSEFTMESIQAKIDANPFIEDKTRRPKVLTLTQSTYDGIIYNADEIKRNLDGQVSALHFDEAWLPHAAFHELYDGMHSVESKAPRLQETMVFATQSTHKLLAGLSQASQILVQDAEQTKLDKTVFNEAYLMHTSTSPQYAIIASCDISAAMMEGTGGHALVEESITEAMEFRRAIIRIRDEQGSAGSWWFDVWGPDTPAREGIAAREEWELTQSQTWHGFDRVDEGFTMLDPIKVTVLTPGLSARGDFSDEGIPASIVSRYLAENGVVVEKTGLYSFFILFTIGITKGRWNTMISELHRFKEAYDRNAPMAEALPQFVAENPRYAATGLRDLCQSIHAEYRTHDIAELTTEIYTSELVPAMLPSLAWSDMTSGRVEHVQLDQLEGRITAVLLTPYPPGIPLLVPGERINASIMKYLKFEESFNARFPGFETFTHGMTEAEGQNPRSVICIKE